MYCTTAIMIGADDFCIWVFSISFMSSIKVVAIRENPLGHDLKRRRDLRCVARLCWEALVDASATH